LFNRYPYIFFILSKVQWLQEYVCDILVQSHVQNKITSLSITPSNNIQVRIHYTTFETLNEDANYLMLIMKINSTCVYAFNCYPLFLCFHMKPYLLIKLMIPYLINKSKIFWPVNVHWTNKLSLSLSLSLSPWFTSVFKRIITL
jgi:hypothetical protein